MYCPLHQMPVLHGNGNACAACDRLGLVVIACELDKMDRTQDTMEAQGYETDFRQSHAVLVFAKSAAPAA